MAAVSATCQMIIHVKDMEAPRVEQCPRSFTEMLAPGQSTKRITWTEPVFNDNVKIQHVMASFLPGHYFSAGKHNIVRIFFHFFVYYEVFALGLFRYGIVSIALMRPLELHLDKRKHE